MKPRRAELDRVFALIADRLSIGTAAPSDQEIADSIGFWTIEQARVTVAALADEGRIRIAGFGSDRAITLPPAPPAPVVDPVLEAGTARILAILGRKTANQPGEPVVANPKPSEDFRNVTVLARGPVLAAILARAAERELSLNKSATSLIEDALKPAVADDVVGATLQDVSTEELLGELRLRLAEAESTIALTAAIARAESAEGQLATLRQQMLGLIAG